MSVKWPKVSILGLIRILIFWQLKVSVDVMPVGALLETRVRFSETNQNLASVIIGYVRETPLSWIKMRPTIRIKRGFSLSLGYGSPHQQNLDVFFFSLNVGGF